MIFIVFICFCAENFPNLYINIVYFGVVFDDFVSPKKNIFCASRIVWWKLHVEVPFQRPAFGGQPFSFHRTR